MNNLDDLQTPGKWIELPYPFVGRRLFNTRFKFTGNKTFEYMGREVFAELREQIATFIQGEEQVLNIQGTIGEGKSHLLAAAVCFIIAKKKQRVVYLPNCAAFATDQVAYLRAALALALHDQDSFLDRLGDATSLEELKTIIDDWDSQLVWIFDQWNALETGKGGAAYSDVKDVEKVQLRQYLREISGRNHHRILGSSANDLTLAVAVAWYRASHPAVFSVTGGLTAVSYPLATFGYMFHPVNYVDNCCRMRHRAGGISTSHRAHRTSATGSTILPDASHYGCQESLTQIF